MIIPGVAFLIPTGIWLLRSYLEKIPKELEEAAYVDGASRLYTLRRVVIPLAIPGLIVVGTAVFIGAYAQQFLFAITFNNVREIQPLPAGLFEFVGYQDTTWNELMAAALTGRAAGDARVPLPAEIPRRGPDRRRGERMTNQDHQQGRLPMTHLKTLTVAAALMAGTALSAQAQELHFIMCGGEVRPADQVVIDKFQADNPGVTVKMEAVEWGTCQDKSMQLAAAGDPPDVAYMGSRTLRQLANNDLIVPVTFTPEEEAAYQPGVLKTVTNGGQYWGIPHAFSTKALYINCTVVEAAGAECKAPPPGPTSWPCRRP
jgi:hypothetical protein